MSNYSYNPNVDLTDYKPRQINSQSMNNYMTPEYNFPQEQFSQQPQMNNYNQIPPPMNNYNQPPQQMNYQQPPMNYYQQPRPYKKRNKVINNIEKLDLKKPKKNIPILKKLAIYIILFIIFSHNISITFMCSKLTFLQDNDTLCLLTRSILFAISLYFIQKINVI
jgi:hypothetical protein